jgi:hypothetical protein
MHDSLHDQFDGDEQSDDPQLPVGHFEMTEAEHDAQHAAQAGQIR